MSVLVIIAFLPLHILNGKYYLDIYISYINCTKHQQKQSHRQNINLNILTHVKKNIELVTFC